MTKTVTKADITERLHNELGLNKSECKIIVEDFFRTIKEALLNNEQVKLSGFGNFELIDKKSRPGRNPRTGEEVKLSLIHISEPTRRLNIFLLIVPSITFPCEGF